MFIFQETLIYIINQIEQIYLKMIDGKILIIQLCLVELLMKYQILQVLINQPAATIWIKLKPITSFKDSLYQVVIHMKLIINSLNTPESIRYLLGMVKNEISKKIIKRQVLKHIIINLFQQKYKINRQIIVFNTSMNLKQKNIIELILLNYIKSQMHLNQKTSQKPIQKQKKLLIKKIMGWIRQALNVREIGFHPLILCVSIKPSVNQRCATLQSYPNQDLWKSLHTLKEQELLEQIKQEVYEKTFKLKDIYDNSIMQEFLSRIKNNFDFFQFYKKTEEINLDSDEHGSNSAETIQNIQKKKVKRNESEPKQLLKQIELCNSKSGSIVTIQKQHFHKLSQLFQKISQIPEKLQSGEMKQFKNKLQQFLNYTENLQIKKVCIQNEKQIETEPSAQNDITISEIQIEQLRNQILEQTKQEIKTIEPGIDLFIPDYKQVSISIREEMKQIEEDYFSELYYQKLNNPENINSKNILIWWRQCFEPIVYELLLKQMVKTE
ncbi:unnamed protein product [Paramecium sonneborni]|uniref:Uncharacterized protein n=1 Tax=Paramecium sonneborni TaxID=65129 RepID=A0A8S1QUY3_9CILI|nr:unnamed protein product [Paramecium sonneborni]